MGSELPDDARDIISKWTEKSYRFGLGQEWDDNKWKVTDRNAINFFREHDQYFFGNQFQHYGPQMKEIIENELKGIARAYDPEVIKALKMKMGDAFEHPTVKDYYDLVVRNAVNKSRNFGRTLSYERLGIGELEIVAIMDQKTSRICRAMNGRRIQTTVAADHVREVLKTPMDELTEKFSWPSDNDAKKFDSMSTKDILASIKVKLPPYHGRCRTTTVISMDTKIEKSSGGSFSGEFKYNESSQEAAARAKQLEALSKQELLSKIDARVSTAYWPRGERDFRDGTYRTSEEYHRETHRAEFPDGYDKALKNALKSYDRIITYTEKETHMWIYYNSDNKGFLLVNESGSISRFNKQSLKQWMFKDGVEIQ